MANVASKPETSHDGEHTENHRNHFYPLLLYRHFTDQTLEVKQKKYVPLWQGGGEICHFGRPLFSPLRKGGDFLTASGDGFILTPQSLDPLPTTGLAHLHNHKILTPIVAGVDLFGLGLARLCK